MQVNNDTMNWDHYEEDILADTENTVSTSSIYNLNEVLSSINTGVDKKNLSLPISFKFTYQKVRYRAIVTARNGKFILSLKIQLMILPYSSENLEKREIILKALKDSPKFYGCKVSRNSYVELIIETMFEKSKKTHTNKPSATKIVEATLITLLDIHEDILDLINSVKLDDTNFTKENQKR